jgi:hypothetical protein
MVHGELCSRLVVNENQLDTEGRLKMNWMSSRQLALTGVTLVVVSTTLLGCGANTELESDIYEAAQSAIILSPAVHSIDGKSIDFSLSPDKLTSRADGWYRVEGTAILSKNDYIHDDADRHAHRMIVAEFKSDGKVRQHTAVQHFNYTAKVRDITDEQKGQPFVQGHVVGDRLFEAKDVYISEDIAALLELIDPIYSYAFD